MDVDRSREENLVYIKTSLPSKLSTNFKSPDEVQIITFEINLRKEKWLFVSIYKPLTENSQYFLGISSDLLDFYLSMYDNKVVLGDFNLEPTNPIMLTFASSQNFIDLHRPTFNE